MLFKVIRRWNNAFLRSGYVLQANSFSSDSDSANINELVNPKTKYKIFQDEDSPIILDVNEEKLLHQMSQKNVKIELDEEESTLYKRGVTGVFDVEELVGALKKDNAQDIFVVAVPEELRYVDYLVIVTGLSRRHLLGLAEYIRSLYKRKRHSSDVVPAIEGENSPEWLALDLGNIALHIMSESARERYDLESLWSIGAKYDIHVKSEEDSLLKLIKKHSIVLDDIHPLQSG